MSVEIPLQAGLPHFEVQTTLDDQAYTLELRWSVREERWYLDVYTEEREPLYRGIAVVINYRLGFRCADDRWPKGALFAVDTSTAQTDPGLEDFGERVKLIYFTESELPIDISAFVEV